MPFRFVISPCGRSVAALRSHDASAGRAVRGNPLPGNVGRLTLDTLPYCVLAQIVERLPDATTVALHRTSKRLRDALEREFVAPIRLAERLQWIVSNTAFQQALRDIAQLAPAHRSRFRALMQIHPLHPAIKGRACAALLVQYPPAQPTVIPTGLEAILALAPADRADRLMAWIRTAPRQEIDRPTMPAWLDIAITLPETARAAVLAALAARMAEKDAGQWRELLDTLLAAARNVGPQAGPASVAGRAQLLMAVATALAEPFTHPGTMAYRSVLWHDTLREAWTLPPPMRQQVWKALAKGVAHEFTAAASGVAVEPRDACWHQMLGIARNHMSADQASDVMIAMLKAVDEQDELVSSMPAFIALIDTASRLPDTLAAPILGRVVEQAFRAESATDDFLQIWDAVFEASSDVEPVVQHRVLAALGLQLAGAPDPAGRWLALCERVAALPVALRREPLLSIISVELSPMVPAPIAVPRLMALLGELDSGDRAAILSAMIQVYYDDAVHWRDMVVAAVDLPLRDRREPLACIADHLVRIREPLLEEPWHMATPGPASAAPGDVSLAASPASEQEARRQFNDLLGMLSWADRGYVLFAVAPHAATHRFTWLIEEGLRLPRSGRYEVMLFTTLAERATKLTRAEDAALILPALTAAVCTLKPDQCASALYWLCDACAKANMPAILEPARARFGTLLPIEDRRQPADGGHGLKRKATNQQVDTGPP